MSRAPRTKATDSLIAHVRGSPGAAAELLPQVYDTLRRIAGNLMRQERPDHTLQPTALVHEAYIRLIDVSRMDWKGKAHFRNMAAREMRRILVDHARRKGAAKRGAGMTMVTVDDRLPGDDGDTSELLALDEALEKLATRNERQSRVAELRIFAGMSIKETSFVLGVSEKTVNNDWQYVRVWLAKELRSHQSDRD